MLAALTTLRVGGPAQHLVTATTETELVDAVRTADDAGSPVLLVAGGSNVVIGDDGWPGTVVHVRTMGVTADDEALACAGSVLTVAAGHPWDDLVDTAVRRGLAGIEALSGIPGSTGATPVQNVGAYGQEVAQTIMAVRTYDRVDRRVHTFAVGECGFGYRDSMFKRAIDTGPNEGDRYVVLTVTFQLPLADLSTPIAYAELARHLGVDLGSRVPLAEVRSAVLALRRAKGMVLDVADHDTWSVGSFFTNPVLDVDTAERLPVSTPRWSTADGRVKVSAAWLIDHAGIGKGYGLPGPAAVSTKHTLALTNRGGATAADVVALAREVIAAVRARFGVTLEPEARLVGINL